MEGQSGVKIASGAKYVRDGKTKISLTSCAASMAIKKSFTVGKEKKNK